MTKVHENNASYKEELAEAAASTKRATQQSSSPVTRDGKWAETKVDSVADFQQKTANYLKNRDNPEYIANVLRGGRGAQNRETGSGGMGL